MQTLKTQILIVGGGPAGMAAAVTLGRGGCETLIVERGAFAQGVAGWPVYMKLFSTSELVELCDFPLTIPDEKPTRQQYLRYLARFASEHGLKILTHREVTALEGEDGAFVARGRTRHGEDFEVRCGKVVLATGAYDHPNRLGVPGEDLPHVSHYYREVNDYVGQRVTIVGGRHSAAEAALELARAGVDVTMVHRGAAFEDLKYWIGPDLANRIKEGAVKAQLSSRVVAIGPREVEIENTQSGERTALTSDAVLALTGYHPDPEFLGRMGVAVDAERKQPVFDEKSFESTRRGVYLAGVMLAGNMSGAIFIENSRFHGERVLAHLRARVPAARVPALERPER
jgi:thioredoxin reductase (NADPH)